MSVGGKRPEEVETDEYSSDNAPDPIDTEFRTLPIPIIISIIISPGSEPWKIILIVLFQIVLWHFLCVRVVFCGINNKTYKGENVRKNP
jgi:hypothetical protein